MKSRIATLLAAPLVVFALLVTGAGPASANAGADTDGKTLVYHASRQLHFPAAAGGHLAGAEVTAETCVWDTYIYRANANGDLVGETAVACDATMYQISVQAQLLINGGARPETNRIRHRYGYPNNLVTTPLSVCLPGVNKSYGSVLVVNFAGLAASGFGESPSTITC